VSVCLSVCLSACLSVCLSACVCGAQALYWCHPRWLSCKCKCVRVVCVCVCVQERERARRRIRACTRALVRACLCVFARELERACVLPHPYYWRPSPLSKPRKLEYPKPRLDHTPPLISPPLNRYLKHTSTAAHSHTHTHTCVYIYIPTYVCTCMRICICYIYIHIHTYIYICAHTYAHTRHTHTYIYIYIPTYICTCTYYIYTCVHIYTYIYICTYICTCKYIYMYVYLHLCIHIYIYRIQVFCRILHTRFFCWHVYCIQEFSYICKREKEFFEHFFYIQNFSYIYALYTGVLFTYILYTRVSADIEIRHVWMSHVTRIKESSLILIGHFLQKSHIIIGYFAKNKLQCKASYGSLPLCMNTACFNESCHSHEEVKSYHTCKSGPSHLELSRAFE